MVRGHAHGEALLLLLFVIISTAYPAVVEDVRVDTATIRPSDCRNDRNITPHSIHAIDVREDNGSEVLIARCMALEGVTSLLIRKSVNLSPTRCQRTLRLKFRATAKNSDHIGTYLTLYSHIVSFDFNLPSLQPPARAMSDLLLAHQDNHDFELTRPCPCTTPNDDVSCIVREGLAFASDISVHSNSVEPVLGNARYRPIR